MSILSELFNTLDKPSLGSIGTALGESDQAVPRGTQTAIATVLGGMACKSDDSDLLRRSLDLAPSGAGGVTWSSLASGIADPNSPGMTAGKKILSALFGRSEGLITQALGAGTGMSSGTTTSLLVMAAPMVMSFLGKRVRDQGMSMGGLGNLLQREVPAIRETLPSGVTDLLWPRVHETVSAPPVVAQTITREARSPARWLVPLVILALIPLIWLLSRGHRPAVQTPPAVTGTANRAVTPAAPKAILLENVDLYFDTGSTKLRPESRARLDEFASALANKPDAHLMVNGYTDSVGSAASNLRLSQARADAVKDDLVRRGISADRLTARGFGEESPVADNTTSEGRGRNRHVTVGVGD